MSHECTTCGRTFPDGSKEMLSGCPDCGGNKFQFHPGGTPTSQDTPEPSSDASPPEPSDSTDETSADSSFYFGSPRSGQGPEDPDETAVPEEPDPAPTRPGTTEGSPDADRTDTEPPAEDRAQASARSTFVSEDELPTAGPERDASTEPSGPDDADGAARREAGAEATEPDSRTRDWPSEDSDSAESGESGDSADISELREELNEQFESIKIHARGEYELNLMELYDREEHIIALEEDGRYVINVPNSWRESDEET